MALIQVLFILSGLVMFGMTYLHAKSLSSENQAFPKMVGILIILRLLQLLLLVVVVIANIYYIYYMPVILKCFIYTI